MTDQVEGAVIAAFVALIVAGLSNFGAEAYRRHRDATALAGGLAGELASYSEDIPKIIERWSAIRDRAASGEKCVLAKIPFQGSAIFEANVANLGLLGPRLAEDVVYVYSNINAMRNFLSAAANAETAQIQAQMTGEAIKAVQRAEDRGRPLAKALRHRARIEFMELS